MQDSPPPVEIATGSLDPWERLERVARILSLAAIPVALAVIGWFIQNSLSERSVSQEYVKLAVTILTEPKEKADPLLRSWAADLLNQNSPTKFSSDVLKALKEGQTTLPTQIAALLSGTGGGALASAPDGKIVATGHADGSIRLWDVSTGTLRSTFSAHDGRVTGIAFAPDGRSLLSGSFDKTARLWDIATGKPLGAPLLHTAGIIGVAFASDGKTLFTRSLDGTIRSWDAATSRPLATLRVPE